MLGCCVIFHSFHQSTLFEADRAAGVDPNYQHQQEVHNAPTVGEAPSSSSLSTTDLVYGGVGAAVGVGAAASATSLAKADLDAVSDDNEDSETMGPARSSTSTSSRSSAVSGAGPAWAKGGSAMGKSGRSLGDAAAALRDDDDDSEDQNISTSGGASASETGGVDSSDAPTASALAAFNAASPAEESSNMSAPVSAGRSALSIGGISLGNASYRTGGGGSDFQASDFSSSGPPSVGEGNMVIGAAAAAAAAAVASGRARPPSGRGSRGSSRPGSYDPALATVAKGELKSARSRTTSHGSGDMSYSSELRELTDEERHLRMQESDAARAASLLRGSSFKVPLQPDLERAMTDETQVCFCFVLGS